MALTTDLLFWYDFSETTGTRADSVGSFDLSPVNTPGTTTDATGTIANLDRATSEYFTRTGSQPAPTNDFTLAAWVDTDDNSLRQWLFDHGGDRFWMEYNSNFTLGVGDATGTSESAVSYTLPNNTQVCMVAEFDDTANQWELFINNVSQGTGSITRSPTKSATGAWRIGTQSTGAVTWDGSIGSAAMWDRVLGSTDRTAYYNSGTRLEYADIGGGAGQNSGMFLAF